MLAIVILYCSNHLSTMHVSFNARLDVPQLLRKPLNHDFINLLLVANGNILLLFLLFCVSPSFLATGDKENQGTTPLALLALLLLFTLPLLLTFQKLVVLDVLGERSHQL